MKVRSILCSLLIVWLSPDLRHFGFRSHRYRAAVLLLGILIPAASFIPTVFRSLFGAAFPTTNRRLASLLILMTADICIR